MPAEILGFPGSLWRLSTNTIGMPKLLTLLTLMLLAACATTAQAQFTFTTNNGALTIKSYTGTGTVLTVPSETNGYPITGIGAGAFLRQSTLTRVILPDSIVTIGDSAFASCFSLVNLNFPTNLASMGATVFNGCLLTNVALPRSMTNIAPAAFVGCTTLEQITVDPLNAYYSDLDGVLFNKSQTALIQFPARRTGNYIVPGTVGNIGDHAFSDSDLQHIDCPAGITNLGTRAFYNAGALTNFDIPDAVTTIGDYAFSGCRSLRAISIPDGVTNIGSYTFSGCSSLTNLHFGAGLASIGPSAFYGCSALTQVSIPDSVTTIYWQAFLNCSGLRTVWVGRKLATIESSAFLGCVNLSAIYFTGNAPAVGLSIFGYSSVIVYYLPQTTNWGSTLGGWPTKLWNPTVQTSGPDFGIRTNGFGFKVTGTPDIPIAITACIDPLNPAWKPLQTCTLTNGSIYFVDSEWTNHPARFYQIRSP